MKPRLRKAGISVVGELPWSTHFCHFYETKQDLLDILIPYFKAGLENNEFCMWVVFDPLNENEANSALLRAAPEAQRWLAEGALEIVPHSDWYLKDGVFDVERVVAGWKEKLAQALHRGYDGIRVNGNEAWLTEKDWRNFLEYERRLNEVIANQQMIVLCTYPLALSRAAEIFDVARCHEFAIARRHGRWEVLETPELKQAKAEIQRLNDDLEEKVEHRTRELAATNDALRTEIGERKLVEETLRQSRQKLRALTARVESLREGERIRISREIHDNLGAKLTGLKLDLEWMERKLSDLNGLPAVNPLLDRIVGATELVDEIISMVQEIAGELRPGVLDKLGLQVALQYEGRRFQERTGIQCRIRLSETEPKLPAGHSTALFRIFQECLTNVARHARATNVDAELKIEGTSVVLRVMDNGQGITDADLANRESLGLLGMKERAELLGGEIHFQRGPNEGTVVVVRVPLQEKVLAIGELA